MSYRPLKNYAHFKHAASLRLLGPGRAEDETRRRVHCLHKRELRTRKECLILISRRQGDRPCIAAWAVNQARRASRRAPAAGDVLEPNRQADPWQRRIVGKAVVCQNGSAIGGSRRKCANSCLPRDNGYMVVNGDGTRRSG